MPPIVRSILAVIAGIVTFVVMIAVVENLNGLIYPSDLDFFHATQEQKEAYMLTLPAGAFVIVLLGWQSGAIVGGAVSAWIAKRQQIVHAGIIGSIVLLGTFHNLQLLPHPEWMWAAGLMLPLPVSILAGYLVMPRQKWTKGSEDRRRPKRGSSNRR